LAILPIGHLPEDYDPDATKSAISAAILGAQTAT